MTTGYIRDYNKIYCTLRGQIKGTKSALFSIKCKGAVWKKKHSYEVNLFTVFAPQRIPEGDNCILHTSITLDSRL